MFELLWLRVQRQRLADHWPRPRRRVECRRPRRRPWSRGCGGGCGGECVIEDGENAGPDVTELAEKVECLTF